MVLQFTAALVQMEKGGRAKDRLKTELQRRQRLHAGVEFSGNQRLDRGEFARTQRAPKRSGGENAQAIGSVRAADLVGTEVAVEQGVSPGRPLVELRTGDLHFPNAELGAAIDFEQGDRTLAGIP